MLMEEEVYLRSAPQATALRRSRYLKPNALALICHKLARI